ncbi:MAG: DUF3048 domain-containing protein [Lachnospiraceae bacterium]|nr:DUF3048 domain-containing protein [Lachnospiraceae bacterium]
MKRLKIAILMIAVTAMLAGCKKEAETEAVTPAATEAQTEPQTVTAVEPATEEAQEAGVGSDRSFLTGEAVGEELHNRRPFAVMMNNIINACPQAGIEEAGVVYEAPVEGALTRLMALFDSVEGMEKIGSVRSCRTYYPMYAMEFDAIYTHYGQAVYAVELLNSDKVNNISGLESQEGAGRIYGYAGEDIFYRTSDRPAPHNCYTSGSKLDDACNKLGYRRTHEDGFEGKFKFTSDGDTVSLAEGKAEKIYPGYQVNKPWFEFRDGKYYRYQYGDAQIDQLTGDQLAYTNIIFQISEWENYDDHGYLNINTMSGGDAYYFTNGTYEKCTWKRESEDSPARYYDASGNEIVLNQGKTWVCIIQDTYEEDIVIE